jgi:ribosome modulation factor
MRWRWLACAALVVGMAAGPSVVVGQYGPPGPMWNAPPPGFRDVERRGFQDGITGAQRDFQNHRRPNVNNRDEFRNPSFIPPQDRRAYRAAFRRGYDAGVRHFFGLTRY